MNLLGIFHKKKSYSCLLLNNNLHFTSRNTLEPCCSANIGPVMVKDLDKKNSIREFIKEKQKYINMLKNGDIPEGCKNCVHLTSYKKTNYLKINKITLNHYTQCNCACIYCTQGNRTLEKIKEDEDKPILYDVLKFINELYDMSIIDKQKLYIDFQGGNISCLKNYHDIINTFINRGVGTIYIPTNNIIYMPVIEKLLAMKKGELCTAIDSGCSETYLKIKQVDKFNKVIENLKKYAATKKSQEAIRLKYIIIPTINDNIHEFKQFLKIAKMLHVKNLIIDIDARYSRMTEYNIDPYFINLAEKMNSIALRQNFVTEFYSFLLQNTNNKKMYKLNILQNIIKRIKFKYFNKKIKDLYLYHHYGLNRLFDKKFIF